MTNQSAEELSPSVRALCVGRHRFLADHLGLVFREMGLDTVPVVGFDGAIQGVRSHAPQLILCDYDLLATAPLEQWERDEWISQVPVIAVSLTRRPNEVHLLDINGIAGFLYLPTLTREDAMKTLRAAARPSSPRFPYPAPPEWNRHTSRC